MYRLFIYDINGNESLFLLSSDIAFIRKIAKDIKETVEEQWVEDKKFGYAPPVKYPIPCAIYDAEGKRVSIYTQEEQEDRYNPKLEDLL
tara:strand:+ start:363 stop:629 length:267 start_codon:yes stop_codon:yes gene_type:complete